MIQLGYKTWRYLGLSVALTYAGLGVFEMAAPKQAAHYFFSWNIKGTKETKETKDTSLVVTSDKVTNEQVVTTIIPLMGARNLSIVTALMVFFHTRQHSEMGVMILSGLVLCVADVVAIWKWRGPLLGAPFLAGGLSWALIGYGLYLEDF